MNSFTDYLSFSEIIKFFKALVIAFTSLIWPQQPSAVPNFSNFQIHESPKVINNLKFFNAQGQEESLSDFKGNVCLVVFWATWCPHCLPEMNDFNIIMGEFAEKGLRILPLSHDSKPGNVENFYKQRKFTRLPIYYDVNMQAATTLGIRGIPTLLLINKQGREIGRLEGSAAWNSQEARNFLDHYLAA